MINYELIPTVPLSETRATIRENSLPELVYLEDPASAVMIDFLQNTPHTIKPDANMDEALNEMKLHGVHLLLVVSQENIVLGIIASEDLLGEKPIQLIQQRRVERSQVLVKMLMVPLAAIPAFEIEDIEHARVGNVVISLKDLKSHYAFVVKSDASTKSQAIRGLFNTSQIGKQLHDMEIANSITKAQSVSELQKRHTD